MSLRASLPQEAVTITPGYSWRIDLDVLFDGERPQDWPEWRVRMHIWGTGVAMSLTIGDGVRFDYIEPPPHGGDVPIMVPIIELTAHKTEMLRDTQALQYLIDIASPDGEPEDYFSGQLKTIYSPPAELLR